MYLYIATTDIVLPKVFVKLCDLLFTELAMLKYCGINIIVTVCKCGG